MDKGLSAWVRLGSLVALIVAATLWITSMFHAIDTRLISIEAAGRDRWTAQDMTIWSLRLDKDNDSLSVPDVSRVIQDRSKHP